MFLGSMRGLGLVKAFTTKRETLTIYTLILGVV